MYKKRKRLYKYIYIYYKLLFFINIFYEYTFFQNSAPGRQTKLRAQGPSHNSKYVNSAFYEKILFFD